MNDAAISIDFGKDWAQILRHRLNQAGYPVDDSDSSDLVCTKYFNALKRRINAVPRTVIRSAEFSFPCQHVAGVNLIIEKAEKGKDLSTHQSTKLLDPDYNDFLLNDWGIQHFHLGTAVTKSGFVERTGPLLFARVTSTHFYMIDVLDHGQWAQQRLLEIMHANWPDSISDHRYPSGVAVEHKLSDDQIRLFRRKGVDLAIQLSDGTVYGPMGGGYGTSGLSTDVVSSCNSFWHFFRECEVYVKQHICELVEIARQHQIEMVPPFCFSLALDNDDVYAIETNSRFGFRIGNTRAR